MIKEQLIRKNWKKLFKKSQKLKLSPRAATNKSFEKPLFVPCVEILRPADHTIHFLACNIACKIFGEI